MDDYPGQNLADRNDKMAEVRATGQTSKAFYKASRGDVSASNASDDRPGGVPSMPELMRANTAMLSAFEEQVEQLERAHARILGPIPSPMNAVCQSLDNGTVAGGLWAQNTRAVELVERLGRALARLGEFG